MGDMLDPQTMKLVQSIEKFMENPPRDMPESLSGQLKELGNGLRGYDSQGEEKSPVQIEAEKVTGVTQGTGNHYREVWVKGGDQPSPGQREFDQHMEAARQAFSEQTADN